MDPGEGIEAGVVVLLDNLGPVRLAALLRAVRHRRMQSRQDVAKRIGTSAIALRRAERGAAPVPLGTLAALAAYYGEDLTVCVETPVPIPVDQPRSVDGSEAVIPAGSSDLAVETLLADLALARLGTVLQSTREEHSNSRRDVASRVGATTRELRRYENGATAVPRGILTALAEFYGEDLDTHFACRNSIPADPSIAGVEEAQVHSGDGDAALGAYVGMLRRLPEQALDEPMTLQPEDLAVLSTALAVEPGQVHGRIAELLARTTRLRRYRQVRRRKRIVSGAGIAVVAATVAGFGTGALVAALPVRADPLEPRVRGLDDDRRRCVDDPHRCVDDRRRWVDDGRSHLHHGRGTGDEGRGTVERLRDRNGAEHGGSNDVDDVRVDRSPHHRDGTSYDDDRSPAPGHHQPDAGHGPRDRTGHGRNGPMTGTDIDRVSVQRNRRLAKETKEKVRGMANTLSLLIVEDNPSDARLLEAYLDEGMLGVGSIEREDTLEGALARLGRGNVDAVILDLGLPDSSGLDTIRQMVTTNPDVPVIVVSGLSDERVAEEAVALGAQDYVLKDAASPKDLARAVTYAIRRRQVIEEAERAKGDQLDAKDRFLSHVSHELRTPLAAVHQFVSLVADETVGPLVDEQRECLVVAMRNIRQLALMIGDLLVMGRMSSGIVEIRPEPTVVVNLIGECVTTFRPLAEDKGINIEVDVDAAGLALPEAWCDPVRTAEVLNNLVDNAVKFTPTGGSVAVGATLDEDCIRVSVRDTGRGVQLENRERVFEQYFREAGDSDSARGGLGLGLFVSRELVERQGGRIWLEYDAASRGSCFEFTLPTSVPALSGAER